MKINIKLIDSMPGSDSLDNITIPVELPEGSTVLNALEVASRRSERLKQASKNNAVRASIKGKWAEGSYMISDGEEIELYLFRMVSGG
jgi:hypothetical protein